MSQKVSLKNLINTRDLGGMRTKDGLSIRHGKLIRSGELGAASDEDLKWLSDHVGLIIDLRTEQECMEKPNPSVSGTDYLHLSVIRNLAAGISRDEDSDQKAFSVLEAEPEQAREFMIHAYTVFVEDEYSVAQYRRFVQTLLEPREKAVLWHCSAGKDRTGFASVIIQELLGVPRADIMEDYLKTNQFLAADLQNMIEMVGRQMGITGSKLEKTLRYMFAVQEEYLEAVYLKTKEIYGGFPEFLSKGLGCDRQTVEHLRKLYLQP